MKKRVSFAHATRSILIVSTLILVSGLMLTTFLSQKQEHLQSKATTKFQPVEENVMILLERSLVRGIAPAYRVVIFGDGTVVYSGWSNVATEGTVTYQITNEDVEFLAEYISSSNFYSFERIYGAVMFDSQSTTTLVSINYRQREVRRDSSCGRSGLAPEELCTLEAKIDEVARTADLIFGAKPDGP